jgi:hypothetical protein
MPFPDERSLYGILMKDSAFSSRLQPLRTEGKPYRALNKLFGDLTNKALLDIIYDKSNDAVRMSLFAEPRANFESKFNTAIDRVAKVLLPLQEVLMFKSFPETYFHPQIAKALHANNNLTDPKKVPDRVVETAFTVAAALDKTNGMRVALGMGYMHAVRREKYQKDGLYNAETVEFTLLTFSYFGAKAYGKIKASAGKPDWTSGTKAQDWFFCWKVIGSLMGLPRDNLHDTFDDAQKRMQLIHQGCKLEAEGLKLLEAFREAEFGDGTGDKILAGFAADENSLLSKRMREYRKSLA